VRRRASEQWACEPAFGRSPLLSFRVGGKTSWGESSWREKCRADPANQISVKLVTSLDQSCEGLRVTELHVCNAEADFHNQTIVATPNCPRGRGQEGWYYSYRSDIAGCIPSRHHLEEAFAPPTARDAEHAHKLPAARRQRPGCFPQLMTISRSISSFFKGCMESSHPLSLTFGPANGILYSQRSHRF